MTNLNGYLKKTLYLFSTLLFFSFFSQTIFADTSLKRVSNSSFSIDEGGNLSSKYTFVISKSTQVPSVITNFSFVLPFEKYDSLKIHINDKEYKYSTNSEVGGTKVHLTLPTVIVDRGNPLKIESTLIVKNHVVVSGENKFVMIPPIPAFVTGAVEVSYPYSWGKLVWSSSLWTESIENNKIRTLALKDQSGESNPSISVVIGSSVGYDLKISKVLENTSEESTILKVTLPREGDGQHIAYTEFSPTPFDVEIDKDSNINISYLLNPGESTNLEIEGYIFFDESKHIQPNTFEKSLDIENYWAFSSDSEHKRLKVYLKGFGLPDNISDINTSDSRKLFIDKVYRYTVDRLTPITLDNSTSDLRRGVKNIDQMLSLGASPDDYTDLLIALLRLSGVPTRMVVGYIPTLNSYNEVGFFHSWAEFWDIDKGQWVQLDPALEDYFPSRFVDSKYDHITMVVRAESSISPQVSRFTSSELTIVPAINSRSSITEILVEYKIDEIGDRKIKGSLELKNDGNRIVRLTSVDLQSGSGVFSAQNLWMTHTLLPNKSTSISLTFPTDRIGNDSLVVATFEDMEGNVFKRSYKLTNSQEEETPLLLLNFIISIIMFTGLYIFVTRILKKKK